VTFNPTSCKEPTCLAPLAYLKNPQTGKTVPTDFDSLTEAERKRFAQGEDVFYIAGTHRSHFKTCTAPNRFTRGKR
jgi:hypothetical protein